MKKYALLTISFILLLSMIQDAWCKEAARTSTTKEGIQTSVSKGRAVSLRVLQERLKACQKKGPCPKELLELAGLTRIIGYVVDEKNHDIILLGQVNLDLPPIYLDDFVVALRNTWLKYAVLKGNTYYYSDPGCSIDPNPKVIERLKNAGEHILKASSVSEIERAIERWHDICRSPQWVRVLGIPFDTRFAWVMVKADYDMKKLADGSDSISVPRFASLTGITLDKAKEDVLQGRPISIPFSSMNRFWFYPGENCYVQEKGVVTIKQCQVMLLTEEEYLNKRGEIVGKGRPNSLAKSFAENFTVEYAEVAKQRPIYTELENLFRFVALAKIIKFKSPHQEAKLDLGYLLDRYPISKTSVSRHLKGRSNVGRFEHRRDFPGGYQIAQLRLPSCGGVGIDIQISKRNFAKDTTGNLAKLRAIVLETRSSPDALFWDYPRKKKEELEKGNSTSDAFVFFWPADKDYPNS